MRQIIYGCDPSAERLQRLLQLLLSGLKADFGMKGIRAKNNSRTLINIAYDVVNLGDENWTLQNE